MTTNSCSATAGEYPAFDRFGRTLEQKWKNGGTVKDQVDYTYDYAGNRLTRDVPGGVYPTDDRDWAYTYDQLHRLTQANKGQLDAGAIGDEEAKYRQKWLLDQLGNWSTYQQDGKKDYEVLADGDFDDVHDWTEEREHNSVNEFTTFGSWEWMDMDYDAAGNMLYESPESSCFPVLTYDAWNRLVSYWTGIGADYENAVYEYDGLNRLIVKTSPNEGERHYYYSKDWQVLVEADPNGAVAMYGYHPQYVDAIAARFTADDMLAYLQDANFNVTALADPNGNVVERYDYTPYGEVLYLDPDFGLDSDRTSDFANEILYTGRWYNRWNQLQYNLNRFYYPRYGRWLSRDPIGYDAGTKNLYEYTLSSPTIYVDPSGLVGSMDFIIPRPKPKPEDSEGPILAPPITPLPSDSPECDKYPCEDTYRGIRLRCLCKCAGDSPWSQWVRGCLRYLAEKEPPVPTEAGQSRGSKRDILSRADKGGHSGSTAKIRHPGTQSCTASEFQG